MKKLLFTLVLVLCTALTVPASAYEMGQAGGQATIISTGSFHSAVVDENGILWMWGLNSNGQIFNKDSDKIVYNGYTPVKAMENVVAVSCGDYHTAAIKTNGSLWMWGLNDEGQLGNGGGGNIIGSNNTVCQTEPVHVLDDVEAISCGRWHTAAIKNDGSLWMWGSNLFGELGNGGVGNAAYAAGRIQTIPVKVLDDVVAVSCGGSNTAVIKADGSLWMWGENTSGELGNGGRGNSKYAGGATIQTVPIKIMDNVVAVSCGSSHVAAIKSDGTLWMWGYNADGQLGNGESGKIADTGSYVCSNVPIQVMDNVVAVSCGYHTAAIKTDGSLWMWGSNRCGELGNGGAGNGSDDYGGTIQTVPIKVMDDVTAVHCGNARTFIIKPDGTLWACGANNYGQLGTGYGKYNTPTEVKNGINVAVSNGINKAETLDEPSTWAKDAITAAIAAGLVPENLQKNYTKPVSRGDVARMFINLIEKSSGKDIAVIMDEKGIKPDINAFADTNDEAVLEANALGVIQGVGNNKYNPDGTFNRAQAAAIINRIARVLGVNTEGYSHSFTDVAGHWVDSALGWPSSVGIISGVGGGKFSPDTELTTEQAIAIAYRALQVLKK